MVMAAAGIDRERTTTSAQGMPGRLRQEDLSESDRSWCLWTHLSAIAVMVIGPFAIVAPLVLWLMRREQSPFVDDHGREVVNLMLTFLVLGFVLVWIPIIGWAALAIWWIVAVISTIRGAIAANAGEFFRYPMTIRFLS